MIGHKRPISAPDHGTSYVWHGSAPMYCTPPRYALPTADDLDASGVEGGWFA